MRYVVARFNQNQRDEAYRIYVADTLFHQARNECLTMRYSDIMNHNHEEDTRSGDEIASEIISKMGLSLTGVTHRR